MQLMLIKGEDINRCSLPQKASGRYWIKQIHKDGTYKDLLCVEALNGEWFLKSNKKASVLDSKGQKQKEKSLTPGRFYAIQIDDEKQKALLYARPSTEDRKTFQKVTFPQNATISIGRKEGSDIHFKSDFVSSKHAMISVKNNDIYIQDLNSSNGTFVNDKKIQKAKLSPGDVISIIDLSIVVGAGFFALNNPDGRVTYNQAFLKTMSVQKVTPVEDPGEIEESSPGVLFFRSPRFKRAIETATIKIDSPPAEEKADETPLIMVIGPALTMGMASGVMAFASIGNVLSGNSTWSQALPMVLMSVFMMVGMILWPILARRQEAKRKEKREKLRKEKYGEYLEDIKEEIDDVKREQAEILHENYVEIQECLSRIRKRELSLWERTETHDDFLDVRLGLGDWPMDAEFQAPERSFTLDDDELQDRVLGIVETPRTLLNVPVVVSLTDKFSMGIVGDRFDTVSFLKALIFQLAALHSYDEVKFLFIYNEAEREEWDFVRWLPHVWTDDRSMRFVARSVDDVRQLSAYLEQKLATERKKGNSAQRYIVFSLDRDLASKCDALTSVFRLREYQDISVLAVYDEIRYLPKECRVVLEVDPEYSKLYDRSDISTDSMGFTPDTDLSLDANHLAILLANTKLESAEAAFELPTMLTFMEMFDAGKIEHLNALTRWKESNPVRSLATPVGVGIDGSPVNLDLHEKVHGPHGLIAGMTGSGKSEFIMTYILSLALNYHPHEVAFVLIDYKGGGMANAFSNLPHTVGVITNLDGASVNRSLASIQSELKRRQAIFNYATQETGVSNIDIYKYQSLHREGRVEEPLPHLFIISDEFAELKTQQPEFMEQLVSAARIGRSLGIHLILATQKPSGVVDDQIWANSRFKICLKVQDKADSMEMIKRPEAAELVETGRFYLQVGYNELFELGQSAFAGAAYHPSDRVEREYDDSVIQIDTLGRPVAQVKPNKTRNLFKDPSKQLDEITDYLTTTAAEEGVKNTPLWLPPLGERIYLEMLEKRYGQHTDSKYSISCMMGEYDDPSRQLQAPMVLDLSQGGNLLLFGSAGSGKTHFLNTLIYSLSQSYDPTQLNFYLLDFGPETLTSFAPLPHVGNVLTSTDEEQAKNLFGMLEEEIAKRRGLFAEHGGDYRSYLLSGEEKMPVIITMINNYAAFSELFEDSEESLVSLTREGTKYGLYFVFTASATNEIRYKVQQNFKQQIGLQFADPDEYSAIFGRVGSLVPAQNPGRGLFKNESGVFEFQAALISEDLADSPRAVREYCMAKSEEWNGPRASRIPVLPEVVGAEDLSPAADEVAVGVIPVGVGKESLQPIAFDFCSAGATLIMAKTDTACERFLIPLVSMVESLQPGVVGTAISGVDKVLEIPHFSFDEFMTATELPKLLILPTFISTFVSLEGEGKTKFVSRLRELSNAGHGLMLSVTSEDFSSVAYDSDILELLAMDEGIWIGDGFNEQYFFKTQGTNFFPDLGSEFGFVIKDRIPVQTKMLSR